MKLLLVGDPHLRIGKLSLALQFISWLDGLIQKVKPDLVVNLGDSLDTHAVIRSEIVNELMAHIYRVIDSGIPYVYVRGNHDQYTPKDGKYHGLMPFKGKIPNLYIVDEPQELFGMTFVPFLANGNDFPRETKPICIAHQTFLGADYGAVNAEEGVDPDSVSAEIIVAGHIHKRHDLGKVRYVGSPFSQDASDVNQVKGISVFDTDTYQFAFHKCPLPCWRSFKFELNPVDTVSILHGQLGETLRGTRDHWVIELTGPKAEVVGYLDSPEYRNLVKNLSIRLKTVFTDKQKQKVSISAVSMEQILSEYVSKVYSGSLDKNLVLSKARTILEEVRHVDQR